MTQIGTKKVEHIVLDFWCSPYWFFVSKKRLICSVNSTAAL